MRFLSERGARVLAREFGERAAFTVAVRDTEKDAFSASVKDLLCGRAEIKTLRSYYAPVN